MTPFIHKATLWRASGLDMYGRPRFAAPEVCKCRWEDVSTIYVDAGGQQQRSASTVYIDRRVEVGDFLARGEHPDLSPYPQPVESGREIKNSRTIENVSGDMVEHRALL